MEGGGMVEAAWRVVERAGSKELVEDGAGQLVYLPG